MNWWLAFVIGAALCWGAYGPSVHAGQLGFSGADRTVKSMKMLLCVGGAYFLLGVLVPVATLAVKGELGDFSGKGVFFSGLGGALGALGAIGVIGAFQFGGKPFIVMPLIFGGAPIINTVVSILAHPPKEGILRLDYRLYIGFVLVGVGAYLVLAFKPQ